MKLGLIGYGFFGRKVARSIARVADFAYIAEPHHGRLTDACADWGPWGTKVTSDATEVMRACDAVWIATPADTHFALVEEALSYGCHVMCEKPFVLDTSEAEHLASLAQAADVALMVGHLSLYTPEMKVARQYLPLAAQTIETIRWNTASSISDHSVLWGLGPHDVALIVALMGEPTGVDCEGTKHRVVAALTWKGAWSDAYATIELDWLAVERVRRIEVGGNLIEPKANGPYLEPLLAEAQEFVELCRHREGRLAKADEAVAVTRTLHRLADAMMGGA